MFADNVEVISTFMMLQTQWKVMAMGGYVGLDYVAVEAVFRMTNVADQSKMLSDVQTMEAAALSILNKRN